jgi:hypothetical protein
LASPTTQQTPHFEATRRERANPTHGGVARSLFGTTKLRRSRLALRQIHLVRTRRLTMSTPL